MVNLSILITRKKDLLSHVMIGNTVKFNEGVNMVNIIPHGKDVSIIHLNPDWGYLAYIEKQENKEGEPVFKVVRVPLEGSYGHSKGKING